jgi:hypothetical protein
MDIRFDEIEKFPPTLKNEGSIISLAEGSVEGVSEWQIHYSSTPTVESGMIWALLQKSNIELYFVPCPHCNGDTHPVKEQDRAAAIVSAKSKGWFIYAWSEHYALGLPSKFQGHPKLEGMDIPMGYVKWDSTAKSKRDVIWDMDKVAASAHVECPHCKAKIFDDLKLGHKEWMDTNGAWLCVKPGEPNHIGSQLSALYAPRINAESSWGGRAIQFLTACAEGGTAVLDFVNRVLALVYVNQEHASRIELTSSPAAQTDWVAQLTADFHKNHPYIWFTVRKWCAFKMLPPFPISNGRPDFAELLDSADNAAVKTTVAALLGEKDEKKIHDSKHLAGWSVIAELMRFDSRTGQSPLIEFLLAKKITGTALVKLFKESAGSNTQDFRRVLYQEIAKSEGRDPATARPPMGGDSELVAAGYLETSGQRLWEELADIEKHFHVGKGMRVPRRCVAIDAGFAEKFQREVLAVCYESGDEQKYWDASVRSRQPVFYAAARHHACLPCTANGWFAIRGQPTMRPLGEGRINHEIGTTVEDPYYGSAEAGSRVVEVLNVPNALFWLRKNDLRLHRTKQLYTVSPKAWMYPSRYLPDGTVAMDGDRPASNFKIEDYQRHINEQFFDETEGKVKPRHGRGGSQSRAHPYHLDDCEIYQAALATHNGFFDNETEKK